MKDAIGLSPEPAKRRPTRRKKRSLKIRETLESIDLDQNRKSVCMIDLTSVLCKAILPHYMHACKACTDPCMYV